MHNENSFLSQETTLASNTRAQAIECDTCSVSTEGFEDDIAELELDTVVIPKTIRIRAKTFFSKMGKTIMSNTRATKDHKSTLGMKPHAKEHRPTLPVLAATGYYYPTLARSLSSKELALQSPERVSSTRDKDTSPSFKLTISPLQKSRRLTKRQK